MKTSLLIIAFAAGLTFTAQSQDIVGVDANARATKLNTKMAQDLQLNNYQQQRLREINQEVVAKMIEMELKYKDDPVKQEEACRGVCEIRDEKLQSVLSTDQYSRYFGAREQFFQYDRQYSNSKIGKKVAPSSGIGSRSTKD